MNYFFTYAYLFFIGSHCGWVMELLFRHVVSSDKKWINPGFCKGPYLPIYGIGLCILYSIARLENVLPFNHLNSKLLLFVFMAICMTLLEYIAGLIMLKFSNVRLWDYSNEWGNVQGLICPTFSMIWTVLGAIYYFFIDPYILVGLEWLAAHPYFLFVIGMFFGVFSIDVIYSSRILLYLKEYAHENHVIVRYEHLKLNILKLHKKRHLKYHFFNPFHIDHHISNGLNEILKELDKKKGKIDSE